MGLHAVGLYPIGDGVIGEHYKSCIANGHIRLGGEGNRGRAIVDDGNTIDSGGNIYGTRYCTGKGDGGISIGIGGNSGTTYESTCTAGDRKLNGRIGNRIAMGIHMWAVTLLVAVPLARALLVATISAVAVLDGSEPCNKGHDGRAAID